jgi:DNA helicase-2/ATP-dependent DNA helicase PcrA
MNEIRQTILARHTDGQDVDEEQLEAIFSSESHLLVEAPAGYGKTQTMVSKIAYLIATEQIKYPKKILALTFSINAAFKIRRDVTQQLPSVLSTSPKLSRYALQVVYATNYHGLCRRILGRYGYLITPELCQIDTLKGIGIDIYNDEAYTETRLDQNLQDWGIELTQDEIEQLIQYTRFIKRAGNQDNRSKACKYLAQNADGYLRIVREKFLPKEYILFDAILLFARKLLNSHPPVRDFYRKFFQVVIIDEFQDTNILQWTLLQDIAGRHNERQNPLFVFGDRHQRIYEFIGAMQGIIDEAKNYYGMQEIRLCTNHRFRDNCEMLSFDENIREIARNPGNPDIESVAEIEVFRCADQDDEASQILNQAKILLDRDPNCTIAILTRAGKTNQNTIRIVDHFNKEKGFSYFFALYSDEDQEYVDFHHKCLSSLYKNLPDARSFHRLSNCIQADINTDAPSETWSSLQILLETFLRYVSKKFRFLSLDEKIEIVVDTLQNKALKQYLMYVTSSQVMLSTVHGSKGLEWDYVILPDMERNSFPHYLALCRLCGFGQHCQLDWERIRTDSEFSRLFKQELNLFYVGGTRGRKKVYFTYSDVGLNSEGNPRNNNPSCFLNLNGLHKVNFEK